MKKLLILFVLGSFSLFSAEQYDQFYDEPGIGEYQSEHGYIDYYLDAQRGTRRNDENYQSQFNPVPLPITQDQIENINTLDHKHYDQTTDLTNTYTNDNQRMMSDSDIIKKIQDSYAEDWNSRGIQEVTFVVNNGDVTLNGFINTVNERRDVENDVRRIEGVKKVDNLIAVTEGDLNFKFRSSSKTYDDDTCNDVVKMDSYDYSEPQLQSYEKIFPQDTWETLDDRQINAKIRAILSGGWLPKGGQTFVIKTSNGFVIVTGTVEIPEDIQNISEVIKKVKGVKSVNNAAIVNSN